jgi:Na+/H+ antiporter NhaD/arsenite permease-like protein
MLLNQINNYFLTGTFLAVLLFFAFFRFKNLYEQDKKNNTKNAQKQLLSTLLIIVVFVLLRFLAKNIFFKDPF